MLKILIVTDCALFTIIFSDHDFHLNQFYQSITFIRPIYQNQKTNQCQKDDHQDSLSFGSL